MNRYLKMSQWMMPVAIWLMLSITTFAQGTTFTYQGRLTDTGIPPTGSYEMEFKLFDAATAGQAQPQPNPVTIDFIGPQAVMAMSGVFTVPLDFGANVFTGAARYLEIAVRHPGETSFTTLTPRQSLTATPYAIQSLNATTADTATNFSGLLGGDVTGTQSATVVSKVGGQSAANIASAITQMNGATSANTANAIVKRDASGNFAAGTITASLNGTASNATNLGGVAANQYVQTNDSRLTNSRAPTGAAGGELSGTYPNPTLANGVVSASKFATLPYIRVRQTSAQTVPGDGQLHVVNLDTVQFSSDITFDNASDQITVHTSGVYLITAEVIWTQNGNGQRALEVNAAGSEVAFQELIAVPFDTTVTTASMIVRLNAGDSVSLSVAQNSGGNLATAVFAGRSATLALAWLGP